MRKLTWLGPLLAILLALFGAAVGDMALRTRAARAGDNEGGLGGTPATNFADLGTVAYWRGGKGISNAGADSLSVSVLSSWISTGGAFAGPAIRVPGGARQTVSIEPRFSASNGTATCALVSYNATLRSDGTIASLGSSALVSQDVVFSASTSTDESGNYMGRGWDFDPKGRTVHFLQVKSVTPGEPGGALFYYVVGTR
jgi:hypothetical protein